MPAAPDTPFPDLSSAGRGVVHATSVAFAGKGILIGGQSGAGKSSLALQMLALGADLISDDITQVTPMRPAPLLSPAPRIAGHIEARGLGLLALPFVEDVPLHFAIWLLPPETRGERLPSAQEIDLFGAPTHLFTTSLAPHLGSALMLCLRSGIPPKDQIE